MGRAVNSIPPPVKMPAETPDEAFRRELRAFMEDTRQHLKDLKAAVDWLVEGERLEREGKR